MNLTSKRRIHIQERLNELYDLQSKWEEKRDLAENPNEERRSEVEIQKIRGYIDQYKLELGGGKTVIEDQLNPVQIPDVKRINQRWILGIVCSIIFITSVYIGYIQVTKVEPDYDKYVLWVNRGDSLIHEYQIPQAEVAYEKALDFNPRDTAVQTKLEVLDEAKTLIASEKYEEAEKKFKVIVEIPASRGLAIENYQPPTSSNNIEISFSWEENHLILMIKGGKPFENAQQPYIISGIDSCDNCIMWEKAEVGTYTAHIKNVNEIRLSLQIEDSEGNTYRKFLSNPYLAETEITIERVETVEEKFENTINQADRYFSQKEYEKALTKYEEALTFKPQDPYCIAQITIVKELIREGVKAKAKRIELVKVHGGRFLMGSNDGFESEKPIHEVQLGSFNIGQSEITVKQYRAYCLLTEREMPEPPPWGWKDNHPMVNVSWKDAQEYCEWVGGRLPTEAEWEYAAKGAVEESEERYSGGNNLGKVAWYVNNTRTTQAALSKAPNRLKIYGMTGNVAEWCYDRYADDYYVNSTLNDPTGPTTGSRRVVRGGSFLSDPNSTQDGDQLRITYRNYKSENNAYSYIGFRVAFSN